MNQSVRNYCWEQELWLFAFLNLCEIVKRENAFVVDNRTALDTGTTQFWMWECCEQSLIRQHSLSKLCGIAYANTFVCVCAFVCGKILQMIWDFFYVFSRVFMTFSWLSVCIETFHRLSYLHPRCVLQLCVVVVSHLMYFYFVTFWFVSLFGFCFELCECVFLLSFIAEIFKRTIFTYVNGN